MAVRKFKTKEPGEPSAAKKSRKERTARGSAVEEETIVVMDETIWKELPEDLRESVVARVPIATIIRFRLVCQKWNSLPFLQHCAPQELPLLYAVVETDASVEGFGALYDPLVKKWYYSTHTPPYHWHLPKHASGGGLVCYPDHRRASFRVGNHLTQTWKVLPWSATTRSSLKYHTYALALVDYPPRSGGYKIIWVEWGGKYGVHDYSSEKSTTTEGRIPANFELHSSLGGTGLAIGSVVYFRGNKPDGIMSYDMVSGTWEQLLIPYPPNSNIVSLAEGGGRLLLVGWVDYNNNADENEIHPCVCVCVWELDMRIRSWIEVDRMPSSYCSEFRYDPIYVTCLGTRRLLVISLCAKPFKRRTTLAFGDFTYDVVSREWSKVPECIPPGCTGPRRVLDGIDFFPCLSASP